MALTSRITLVGPPETGPEDFLSSSLGIIFPDDVTNQHGDAEHSLSYVSPHLPKPLHISLSDPQGESDRRLFSHFLWNSSLLLAEFVERATLGLVDDDDDDGGGVETLSARGRGQSQGEIGSLAPKAFDVAGLKTLELGAGTALPSIMAVLLGAKEVVVTDYPSDVVLETLKKNIEHNTLPEFFPASTSASTKTHPPVTVSGHAWGELTSPDPFASLSPDRAGSFDRIFVCDCLWMPWQHHNLQKSITHFLGEGNDARAWVIAGFHTGRAKMRGFFEKEGLAENGLEVEKIWERDCDGIERSWVWDRGVEDSSERKRWLVVGVLKRIEVGG